MKNTKFISGAIVFSAALIFITYSSSSAARLESFYGDVKYQAEGSGQWTEAAAEQKLSRGDRLEASENSWAQIVFRNGHSSRLESGSSMQIGEIDDSILLELFKGDILSRVSALPEGRSFEVATPQAVTAVRGTLFSVAVNEGSGETTVQVFEGTVHARELVTGLEVVVPAGSYTRVLKNTAPSEPAEITSIEGGADDHADASGDDGSDGDEVAEELAEAPAEEEILAEELVIAEDTDEEASEEQLAADTMRLETRQALRNEIRNAVADIRTDVREAQDVTEQKKDYDVAVGRTLRDYHGNLVRVEQHLVRPAADTFQFINITKRDNYNYRGNFNVTSSNSSRLDSLETRIRFNRDIPEKISGWINFAMDLAESDADFHPLKMELNISNQRDSIRLSSEWDDVAENMGDPELKFISAREDMEGEWLIDFDHEMQDDVFGTEPEEGRIAAWLISPSLRLYRPDDTNDTVDVRIGFEGWLIDNDGKVVGASSLLEGNPFDTMKKIAGQFAGVARHGFGDGYGGFEDTAAGRSSALRGFNEADDFFERNFDLVMTPDIFFNIMEELAKSIDFEALSADDGDGQVTSASTR